MAHTFNASTLGIETLDLYGFKASLVFISSSKPARAIERELVLKNKRKWEGKKKAMDLSERRGKVFREERGGGK